MAENESSSWDVKTIGIAAAAVVGWGAAIYAFTDTAELQKQTDRTISRLQSDISTQQEAAGSVEELQAELASLETETQSLQKQRDGIQSDIDTLQPKLDELNVQQTSIDETGRRSSSKQWRTQI